MTVGVPIPRSAAAVPETLALVEATGRAVPVQVRVLEAWPDGAIKWALLDFQAHIESSRETIYRVTCGATRSTAPSVPGIVVAEDSGGCTVDTGPRRFRVTQSSGILLEDLGLGGEAAGTPGRTYVEVLDDAGMCRRFNMVSARIEERGALRSAIRMEGELSVSRARLPLHVTARVHFFAGHSVVRCDLTVRNPQRARHPGGFWELGDAGSIHFRDLSVVVAMHGESPGSTVLCSPEIASPLDECPESLELFQASSGGANWRSTTHATAAGLIPLEFRGYRMRAGKLERFGSRASPLVIVRRPEAGIAAAMRGFWQNFPKAVEASADGIMIRLFPSQYAGRFELQGGEQKTHTFSVGFGPDVSGDFALDWCRAPLLAVPDPSGVCGSAAVAFLSPASTDRSVEYLSLVNAALEGDRSIEHKREVVDEYGWRNFGDIYADHEAVAHTGPLPLVSHYNNQYDAVAGFAFQFLRSGDARWWPLMDDLARHVRDIDIYHTGRDKPAFNGGLFWHTFHYSDAGKSTHRGYPRAPGIGGGGPSNEHNYTTGLMLHYLMTGDAASREAVIGLANWVIDMDDGRQSIFRWLDRGYTGLASSTASTSFHGPGRGAANSINALLDAHALTGEATYLEKAEQLIRRCIHPGDDIEGLALLDAERRWSYTVFLQALGKYLEHKHERGQLDVGYQYARASLLHYARWMAQREYPYLDKAEILEYPTETWPAHDMRKSDVFMFAALHADDGRRARFEERARFFFDYSTSTLARSPTASLARPLVLMLSNGFMRAWFQQNPDAVRPPARARTCDSGHPRPFVSQKERAKRRAVAIGLLLGTLALVAFGSVILQLL